jgi:hypothetical protein
MTGGHYYSSADIIPEVEPRFPEAGIAEREPVRAWRFEDAPAEFQQLSTGGDEDWVVHIPAYLAGIFIPWLECEHFGRCRISQYPFPDGSMVMIGEHA